MTTDLDPNSIYSEDDLLTRGVDRKVLGELKSDLKRYGVNLENGYLGAWVLNGSTNKQSSEQQYVSAFVFAEYSRLPYSEVLRRQFNKRQLAVRVDLNGTTDMMIDVRDLLLFYQEIESKDPLTEAVINYQDRRTNEALNDVVDKAKRLVNHVIWNFIKKEGFGFYVDTEDLLSPAYSGLLEAAESFDRCRDIKFATHAANRMRGAILDYLRDISPVTRLNRRRGEMINKVVNNFLNEQGREPTVGELIEATGLTIEQIRDLSDNLRVASAVQFGSLKDIASDDEISPPRQIQDKKIRTPLEILAEEETEVIVKEEIDRLGVGGKASRNAASIISSYLFDGLTMKEAAEQIGLSESRAYQILANDDRFEGLRKRLGIEKQKDVKIIEL